MTITLPVTLQEFLDHLNITTTPPEKTQDKMQLRLAAATRACEYRVGPIIARDLTERVRLSWGRFLVHTPAPVTALVSLTAADGTTFDVSGADVDQDGIIEVGDLTLGCERRRMTAVYTAGWAAAIDAVDDPLKLAVLVIADHLYEDQRGRQGTRAGLIGGPDPDLANSADQAVEIMLSGFALPRRALELLRPYEAGGVFA